MKTGTIVLIMCAVIVVGFVIFLRAKQTNSNPGWIEENGVMTYKPDGVKIADGDFGGMWIEGDCVHILNAKTATASSTWYNISDADRVSIYAKRDRNDDGAGSSLFIVETSPNASDYDQYERLIVNAVNTSAVERVASITLTATGTQMASFSEEDVPNHIRVTVEETTDGRHNAWVCAQKSN